MPDVQKPMTDRQASMRDHLRGLPARYRVHGRAGAPLLMSVLDVYDARIWRGLLQRGVITFTSNGFEVH